MTHLLDCDAGKDFNLVLAIQNPCIEVIEATRVIDELAQSLGFKATMENANAVWPEFFARPGRDTAAVLADIERFVLPTIKAACATHHDSYIQRLLAWRSRDGGEPIPQLQNILTRLRGEVRNRAPKSSAYELPIYSPGLDAGYMSFPCLTHLSLKYDHKCGSIHLTALYRNHTYLSHAYGNFVGLGRLMKFLCRETQTRPGELISISTHADGETGGRRNRTREAVEQVKKVLATLDQRAAISV